MINKYIARTIFIFISSCIVFAASCSVHSTETRIRNILYNIGQIIRQSEGKTVLVSSDSIDTLISNSSNAIKKIICVSEELKLWVLTTSFSRDIILGIPLESDDYTLQVIASVKINKEDTIANRSDYYLLIDGAVTRISCEYFIMPGCILEDFERNPTVGSIGSIKYTDIAISRLKSLNNDNIKYRIPEVDEIVYLYPSTSTPDGR